MDESIYSTEIDSLDSQIINYKGTQGILSNMKETAEYNINQLNYLIDSLSDSKKYSEKVKEYAEKGRLNFIQGACYCGQEIGGAENFSDISTSITKIDEDVFRLIDVIRNAISRYQQMKDQIIRISNQYSIKITSAQAKISDLKVQRNIVRAQNENENLNWNFVEKNVATAHAKVNERSQQMASLEKNRNMAKQNARLKNDEMM